MNVTRPTLAVELSKLVAEALVKIGLTESDVLGGAIVHTDLPWQVPPLVVEAPFFGAPFSEYIDRPTYVEMSGMLDLFSECLAEMRNNPRKVLGAEGYKGTTKAIPAVRTGERNLRFSTPEGYPGAVSDYAGVTFALECAHVLRMNARIKDFLSDDDNYYAVLPDGLEIGVKDGLPTMGQDQWDMPVTGMVQELLRQPRGAVWEGCDYNVISKVRSVVKICEKHIVEYEAVDWAIQALRVLHADRELLATIRRLKNTAYERDARMKVLRDAVEASTRMSMTDRQRIEVLKNLLVPDIISPAQFSKLVYNFYAPIPPILSPKVLTRIQAVVQDLLDHEEMLFARTSPGKIALLNLKGTQ